MSARTNGNNWNNKSRAFEKLIRDNCRKNLKPIIKCPNQNGPLSVKSDRPNTGGELGLKKRCTKILLAIYR